MKPKNCCKIGSYKHQVMMPLNGRVQCVDYCVHDLVAALSAANLRTNFSCCGHGELLPSIGLEDGRFLIICTESVFKKIIEQNEVKK